MPLMILSACKIKKAYSMNYKTRPSKSELKMVKNVNMIFQETKNLMRGGGE
jgi:hypothetical protein